ncbi:MAG: thymidine phosphorylase, partial [Polyangiales bacterium]
VLHGRGPDDVVECTLVLGAEMLRAGGLEHSTAAAERRLRAAISSGAARNKLAKLIAAQRGDPRVVEEPDRLPRAPCVVEITASAAGYIRDLDSRAIAELALRLGAGRTRADQRIDPAVGIVLCKKPGDRVRRGEALAQLHMRTRAELGPSRDALLAAYDIGKRPPARQPLVIEVMRPRRRR